MAGSGDGIRLGRIFYDFGANTADFVKGARSVRNRVREMDRAMRPVLRRVKQLGFALTGTAGAMAVLGKRTADAIDRQAKLARSLGTSVASLQVLERAAELSGVQLRQLESGLRVMTVSLARLADGSAPVEMQEAFGRLNLALGELSDLPVEQQVLKIQQAVERFVPEAEQAAVAAQLFGTRAFLAFKRLDSEAIATANRDLERFGGKLNQVQADDVQAMNDSLTRLTTGITAMRQQIVAAAAPAMLRLTERMAGALEAGSAFRESLAGAVEWLVKIGPRLTSYAISIGVVTVAVKGLSFAMAVATANAAALRGMLIRTGFGAAVVGLGEVIYRLSGAGAETREYKDAMEQLTATITGQNTARSRFLELLRYDRTATEEVTEARLKELEATLAVNEARLKADMAAARLSPEYRAAQHDMKQAQLAAAQPRSRWTQLEGSPEDQVRINERIMADIMAPLDQRMRELRRDQADVIALRTRFAMNLSGGRVPGATAPNTTGQPPEYTGDELRKKLEADLKRVARAEGQLMTASQRRIMQIQQERADVLESLAHQKEGYAQYAAEANRVYDELARRAAWNLTWLERLEGAADDLSSAFGDFATETILNFENAKDAAKSFANTVAQILVRNQVTDPFAQGLSAGISGFANRITSTNPWGTSGGGTNIGGAIGSGGPGAFGSTGQRHVTWNASGAKGHADGGVARGYAVVGERGPEVAYFGRPTAIYPNHRLQRAVGATGGGGRVQLDMNVNVNATAGWDELNAAIGAGVQKEVPRMTNAAVAAVQRDLGRPSSMRSAARG